MCNKIIARCFLLIEHTARSRSPPKVARGEGKRKGRNGDFLPRTRRCDAAVRDNAGRKAVAGEARGGYVKRISELHPSLPPSSPLPNAKYLQGVQ